MLAPATPYPPSADIKLPEILRAVRRRHGLPSVDAARDMGIRLRTYQHVEAGAGPPPAEL